MPPQTRRPHAAAFVQDGFCVVPSQQVSVLESVRADVVAYLRSMTKGGAGLTDEAYLNAFHKFSAPTALNDVRVGVHKTLGSSEVFRQKVFACARHHLEDLVGNEIVMQRQVGVVIQAPRDPAGLLALHTDCWSGCSPYEVVLWIPLVDVHDTKSMYICDRAQTERHLREIKAGPAPESTAALARRVRPGAQDLRMKFGDLLFFSSILMHGAEENQTDETRFVLNVRFKSLFSPYGTKAIGETFLPVNYLPATEVGLDYEGEFGAVHA